MEQLHTIKDEWRELLNNAEFNDFFLSHAWIISWLQSFFSGEDQLVVIIGRESNRIIIIAPFMLCRHNEYGFSFPVLRFIGVPNADHCDILVRKGKYDAIPNLLNFMQQEIHGWSQLHMNEIPQNSYFSQHLCKTGGHIYVETASTCPCIPLNQWATWEEYYKNLSKKTRMELNRKNNKLKKEGKSRYVHQLNPSPNDAMFQDARILEKQSAKAINLGSRYLVLADEHHWIFQKKLCKATTTHHVLLSGLYRRDKLIAYLYGYIYNNKYYAYNTAYSFESRKFSPGTLIINETIRYCKEHHVKTFDFLRGATRLKKAWAKQEVSQQNIYWLKNTPKNWLYALAVYRIRPIVKKLTRHNS